MGKCLLHSTINNSCHSGACPASLASLGEDGSGAGGGHIVHRQVPARRTVMSELEVSRALELQKTKIQRVTGSFFTQAC